MARRKKQPADNGPERELVVSETGEILSRAKPLTDEQKARKLDRIVRAQRHLDQAERYLAGASSEAKSARELRDKARKEVEDAIHDVPEQGELFKAEPADVEAARERPLDDNMPGEPPTDFPTDPPAEPPDDRPERGA